MFHSKQDVDRHVNEVFRNIKSEYQRNLKCYQIAKLYYKFKDYKLAIKYINRYILTTTNSAAAHRLLGECYLGLNLKVKAIEAFKASLVLNGSQNDLVLKICTLLMDPDVSAVTPRATYWLERAETLFPTNPVVFQLREHLLKSNSDGKQDNGQLEKLILSEISARPADVTVRIRLLNFYVDTKRYKIAYQHALEIEERNNFSNDLRWYDCLCNVVQAYEKANNDLGFSFFIKKIIFLEKRADLSMQEFQEEVKTLSECSAALFAFDQNLHAFSKMEVPQEEALFFVEFTKHMRAQLSFHLATLILKRAKKEYGIWPKALRWASPLLLQATQTTMELEGAWYSMWPGKNKMEKEIKQLNKSATLRVSQAGHVLLEWSQSKGSKFLERVSQFCGGKWQTHVYQDTFYNREHQQAIATSHFTNDPFFANVPMRLLTETELSHFDEVSQSAYPDSLHHLVWLGLAYCNANGYFNHDFRCTTVPDLQFTVANLSQAGPETLNQLDVDAFLYASVLCAKSPTSNIVSTDRPNRLPVSISEELCSPAQADWWVAVYKTYTNQASGNIADTRLKLRKGIEVIRVFGQHGLHPKIIVSLAKLFLERATKTKNPNEVTGLEDRAYLYWTAAIPLLEKMEKNQQIREVPNRLFDYRGKDLSQNEIKTHLEEGRLFLARRLMNQGRHEQAIEAFQSLKSPYATFYQALIYEELASEEVNHRPESITSENRSQHIILLTRARDALYLTLDRLRCPSVDPNHPLNAQLQDHLDQIERQLAKIDPDSNLKSGDSQSDETDTAPGPLSSDVDETLESSFNIYNTSNFLAVKNQSASRTLRQNLQDKHPTRFEARPSPERLDAQLRHLVQANSNGLQAIVEQLKEMKSTMQIELKDLGCVTRDLLAEMKRWNDRLELASKRTADVLKPEDLFELREEDYEDLNQISQPYPSFPNYQVNRQMTGTQGTSTVTYGTPVPSPIPPVPPVPPVIQSQENPLAPPAFYPGSHPVPPIDPSLLLYQPMGYYAPGMPYAENQNVPDYRGVGMQKGGTPFSKNAFKVPDAVPSITVLPTKLQPPNVVITSSDTLPAFTSGGTPAMSVTVPPQHIRGLAPSSVAPKSSPSQVHPFQIQMPPQAQLIKESPTEKLNSLTPAASVSTSPVHGIVSNVKPTPVQQTSVAREVFPNKTGSRVDKNEEKVVEPKQEENNLFKSRGNLSVFDKDWVDKGSVTIKILHDEKAGKVRIIIHQDAGFLVYVDHFITPDITIKALGKGENGWVWSASDAHKTDSKPAKGSGANSNWQKFRVKFDTLDESKDFEYAFNEGRRLSKESNPSEARESTPAAEAKAKECKTCKGKAEDGGEKCSACLAKDKSSEKSSLGGFTFAASPIVKPPVLKLNQEKEKPKEQPKPSPFAEFSFSGTTTTPSKTDGDSKTKPMPFTSQNPGSANMFAGVQVDPNSFKKDASFKDFEGKGSLIFGYLNKPKPGEAAQKTKKEGDEDGEEEFVPTAEFTPVVDLPDLVDVKTGEENDKVLFDERTKLLRFDTELKEWKERGVGCMRVLLNEENGKVRLIMRRELVLKVCCNHYLDEKMEFKRMKSSEKALTWYAQDYSEGEIKPELFALKFADPQAMIRFENAVSKAQSQMEGGRIKGTKVKDTKEEKPKELKPLSELFKPKAGSWECGTCLIRNNASATKCVSCETPKTPASGPTSQTEGLGKGISFPTGTAKFSFGIPTTTTTASSFTGGPISAPKFTFGIPQSTTASTTFTSGALQSNVNANSATAATTSGTPATKFTFGIPQMTTAVSDPSAKVTSETGSATTTATPSFTFGIPKTGATATSSPISSSSGLFTSSKNQTFPSFGGFTSCLSTASAFPTSLGVAKSDAGPASNVPVSTSAGSFTFGGVPAPSTVASKLPASPAFTFSPSNTFGAAKTGITSAGNLQFSSPTVTFGTAQSAPSAGALASSASPNFVFSTANATATKSTFSPFTAPSSKAEDKTSTEGNPPRWTVPEGKEKFGFSLSNIKPAPTKVSPQKTKSSSPKRKASGASSDESGGEEDGEDNKETEEDNVIVKPIVPLPEKVAPHTGEEEEDVLYEQRAKLFRFADKEWKERGIGAVKILKHKTHNKIRMLMRRETILKVCLNHYLTPDIEFKAKDEKTWTWTAADFSEGEVTCNLFAIRFKNAEIAREFKKALDDAQNNVTPTPSKQEKAKEPSAAMKCFTFAVPNLARPEPPVSSQSSKSDDDVLVVYENKVTPEQRQKAISLHLPPNFYAYLQAPGCPGCPGCDEEDAPVEAEQAPAAASTSNPSFGNKSWGSLNFGGDSNSERKVLFTFAGNQGTTAWNAGLTAGQKLTPNTGNEDEDEGEEEEDDEDEEEDEDVEEEDEDEGEGEGEVEDEEDLDDENEDYEENEEYEDNEENEDAEDEDYGEGDE